MHGWRERCRFSTVAGKRVLTTFFIVTAALGFGLLLLGLVFDDFLEFMDGDGGVLSAPVIGAFLGAFGIGGFVGTSATGNVLVGLVVAGSPASCSGGSRCGSRSPSSACTPTPRPPAATTSASSAGSSPHHRGGGEILIRVGGSPVKLVARADTEIERGTEVVVVEVLSPTSVRVMTTNELLEQE
jgi:hypothetical protein